MLLLASIIAVLLGVFFLRKVKDLRILVRIYTNGSNPKILKQLIDDRLVDSAAMDIKLKRLSTQSDAEMERLAEIAKKYVKAVKWR